MVSKVSTSARSSDLWFDDLPLQIDHAVRDYNFATSSAYRSLSDLATAIEIENVVVDPESAVVSGKVINVSGTVYLTLIYAPNSDDRVDLPDSYPIEVTLSLNDKYVHVRDIEADVSSFYK